MPSGIQLKYTMEENLTLMWADFQRNVETSFGEVKMSQDFTDVTLVGDDYEVEAHRLVLSSGSIFFQEVLKRTRHPHPLLYLKGTLKTDIEAILSFLYTGEAKVAQDNLEQFIETAKELKIKGVLDEQESSFEQAVTAKLPHQEQNMRQKKVKGVFDEQKSYFQQPDLDRFPQQEPNMRRKVVKEETILLKNTNLKHSGNIGETSGDYPKAKSYLGREYPKTSSVRSYFNDMSILGLSECNLCGKLVKTKNGNTTGLWKHMERVHYEIEIEKGARHRADLI